MDFPEPYRLADRAILGLNRSTVRLFDRAKNKSRAKGFDELTVFRSLTELYDDLDDANRRQFRWLWGGRYREVCGFLKHTVREDILDDLMEMHLAGLLSQPNPLTGYSYETETMRKRDRAIESINAAGSRSDKDLAFDRAMRYWSQQTGFYIDIVADEAALQAMKDSGVKKVRWITSEDNRVCDDCKDLNGKVFDIDNVPDKPHVRCRCWLVPA